MSTKRPTIHTRAWAFKLIATAAQTAKSGRPVSGAGEQYMLDCLAWTERHAIEHGAPYAAGILNGIMGMATRLQVKRAPCFDNAYFCLGEIGKYGPDELEPEIAAQVKDAAEALTDTFAVAA